MNVLFGTRVALNFNLQGYLSHPVRLTTHHEANRIMAYLGMMVARHPRGQKLVLDAINSYPG